MAHAERLCADGAEIVEVGGEATSPGAEPLSAEKEIERIREIVSALAPRMPLSIDTYHAATAEMALTAGALMINDVSALRADTEMVPLLARSTCRVVLCFNRFAPLPHVDETPKDYDDAVGAVREFFAARVAWCKEQGIAEERLIFDPALGRFVSHDPKYSWQLIRESKGLIEGCAVPFMLGASRKGFLGGKLAERDPISAFVAVHGVRQGYRFIRTHNPRMTMDLFKAECALTC